MFWIQIAPYEFLMHLFKFHELVPYVLQASAFSLPGASSNTGFYHLKGTFAFDSIDMNNISKVLCGEWPNSYHTLGC